MVANEKHIDQINNGFMEGDAFHISNSLFYIRPGEYPPTEHSTPTGRSTNIPTPSSSIWRSTILNPTDLVRRISSLNLSSLFRREAKIDLNLKKLIRIYEAESPDEYCLVNAAKSYGFTLVSRDMNNVFVTLPTQRGHIDQRKVKFRIAKILKFDSTRRRMSVVIDREHQKVLLCKGADDEIIGNLCKRTLEQSLEAKTAVENSKTFLKMSVFLKIGCRNLMEFFRYSRNGLRTLCMAMKVMTNEEYNRWEAQHDEVG